MRQLRGWCLRFAGLFHKEQQDLELAEELESHLQMLIEDNLRAGMKPAEARRQALIQLGGVEQAKEKYRERRGLPVLESLIQDVRFGFRMLSKNPGFTVVAVLTLALGMGANTAIFSVVDAVLLKSLPYHDPDKLVEIWNTYFPSLPQLGLSGGDFQNWKDLTREFSGMGAYRYVSQEFNVAGEGEPQRLEATYATSTLFSVLEVSPVVGRTFNQAEDKPGSAPVIMISHRVWQNLFNADPHVVGRLLTLDGEGFTLVGVLPADFSLVNWADLWLPTGEMDAEELTGRVHHPFAVIARLRPGVSISQAQTGLSTLARQAEIAFPATNRNFGVIVHRLQGSSAAKMRGALLMLFAAVGLVLLIACANIVNLLLARSATRQSEIALRTAVGASRNRIARQLITETLLLFLLGGTLGLVLAIAGLNAVHSLIAPDLANVKDRGLNGGVLLFTFSVCIFAGILCGLAPVVRSLKTDLSTVLKEGGRGLSAFGVHKVQSLMVTSEIAVALVLLIGAGLVTRSFRHLLEVNPGFRTDHLLTMQVPEPATHLNEVSHMSPDQLTQLSQKQSLEFEELTNHLRSLPGVEQVGGIDVFPLASSMSRSSRFVIEGQAVPVASARPFAEIRTVSIGYFDAMRIPLLKGRLFTEEDWALPRIVINKAMSERFWANSDSIGQRINACSLATQPCWFTIIGVVGNVHQFGLDAPSTFDVYTTGGWTPYVVIRTASDSLSVAAPSVAEVHKIDPNLPVTQVMTADKLLSDSFSPRRFSMLLLAGFATLALLMAVVGIYGVMNYAVVQRMHEIGIRAALGAQRGDILRLIMSCSVRVVFTGVVIGLVGALTLTKLLSSFLYDTSSEDPLTFAGMAFLLVSVALVASFVPAWRAMRVDPAIVLRHE
jgi:putative ABC transport system permease protein